MDAEDREQSLSNYQIEWFSFSMAGYTVEGMVFFFLALFGFGLCIKWKHADESDVHLKCMYTSDCGR